MTALDVRPGRLDVRFRPGNAVVLELAFPAGSLAGRTFTATLDADPLALDVAGDTITLTAPDAQTETIDTYAPWALVETVGAEDEVVIVGRWVASHNGAPSPDDTVTVVCDTTTVTVNVLGRPGPPGPAGAASGHRHVQDVAAEVWDIQHDFGFKPGGIYAEDTAHIQFHGRITHVDNNRLTIEPFVNGSPAALMGEAYIS